MRLTDEQRDDVREFIEWAQFWGLAMPPGGAEVANYLLEMLADGAPLPAIKHAAKAIILHYERHRVLLDRLPIKAALGMCAAQLSPNRTLN